MQLGLIGLGNMGRNLALNLQEHGHDVICWNRSTERRDQAKSEGLKVVDEVSELVNSLSGQRIVWLMMSAGSAIDDFLFGPEGLASMLQAGDIVVEGANSHFTDSQRRAAKMAEMGIKYIDCGVSGGIQGARHGACMMAGGDAEAFKVVEPLMKDACVAEGYGHFGPSGAGHFVKMVHNAIEYGMMQAISEGVNLISKSEFDVKLTELTNVWNHGSIIQSNLIGFLHGALTKDPTLQNTKSEIGSLGTGMWASEMALKLGVPFTAITHAVFARYQSLDKDSLAYKVTQAMRAEFGGHNSEERPAV
jgi:6-phosphogluconate dehydrogenase